MAENKGDEVLCTKKGGDQRAGMKSDCAGRVALPPQVVGDAAVPHAAWRLLHRHTVRHLEKGWLPLS